MKKLNLIFGVLMTFLFLNVHAQTETFSKFVYGTNTQPSLNDTSQYLNTCMLSTGWTGKNIYSAGGAAFIKAGYIITPVINLSSSNTITFYSWTNHSADQLIVDLTTDNGVTWINSKNISVNGTKTLYTESLTGGTTTSKLRISSKVQDTTNNKYDDFLIDDITINNCPLPVQLESFISIVENNIVKLTWKTVEEVNNSGFEIYRNNEKIGFVKDEPDHTYKYEDKYLQVGTYTYKLKQLDYNGNFEWFVLHNEVNVKPSLKTNIQQNYPNPINPHTTIRYNIGKADYIKIKIFNVLGKEIQTIVDKYQTEGYYLVHFDSSTLPSGIYYYKLEAGSFNEIKKMIVLK